MTITCQWGKPAPDRGYHYWDAITNGYRSRCGEQTSSPLLDDGPGDTCAVCFIQADERPPWWAEVGKKKDKPMEQLDLFTQEPQHASGLPSDTPIQPVMPPLAPLTPIDRHTFERFKRLSSPGKLSKSNTQPTVYGIVQHSGQHWVCIGQSYHGDTGEETVSIIRVTKVVGLITPPEEPYRYHGRRFVYNHEWWVCYGPELTISSHDIVE